MTADEVRQVEASRSFAVAVRVDSLGNHAPAERYDKFELVACNLRFPCMVTAIETIAPGTVDEVRRIQWMQVDGVHPDETADLPPYGTMNNAGRHAGRAGA